MTQEAHSSEEFGEEGENIRVLGNRAAQPQYLEMEFTPDVETDGDKYWGDLSQAPEVPGDSYAHGNPPIIPRGSASSHRAQLLQTATDLAYDGLETFREAIDVLAVTDPHAHDDFRKLLLEMGKAAESISSRI